MDLATICSKIRVVLDKGHYLHDMLAADQNFPDFSGLFFEISTLFSGVDALVDPRLSVQAPYALGSLLNTSSVDNKIEFSTMTELCNTVHSADEALDHVLNHCDVPQPDLEKKSTAVILSQVLTRLSGELMRFKESIGMGLEGSRISKQEALKPLLETGDYVEQEEIVKELFERGTEGDRVYASKQLMKKGKYVEPTEVVHQLMEIGKKSEGVYESKQLMEIDIEGESVYGSEQLMEIGTEYEGVSGSKQLMEIDTEYERVYRSMQLMEIDTEGESVYGSNQLMEIGTEYEGVHGSNQLMEMENQLLEMRKNQLLEMHKNQLLLEMRKNQLLKVVKQVLEMGTESGRLYASNQLVQMGEYLLEKGMYVELEERVKQLLNRGTEGERAYVQLLEKGNQLLEKGKYVELYEVVKQLLERGTEGETWDPLRLLLGKGMDGKREEALNMCIMSMSQTLAKFVYDYTRVKGDFELRVWVDVSSSPDRTKARTKFVDALYGDTAFKRYFYGMKVEQKIAHAVYQVMSYNFMAVTNYLPPVYSDKFELPFDKMNMEGAQDKLMRKYQGVIEEEMSGRKFLLVLDGISEDHMSQWEDLFAPFRHGSSGSKVIITSRSSHVVDAFQSFDIQNVNAQEAQHGLFWKFFCSFAFDGKNPEDYHFLHGTGKLIAKYLNRFPLACRMIGNLLNTNLDEAFWKSLLDDISKINNNEILKNEHYQLMLLIKLSFNQLPAPICWCFKYCSIFPKDWRYSSETLIHLWMSQGFISSAGTNQRLEDIGKSYFDCLLSRSFFDLFATDGKVSYYVMHRSVHYLAEILFLGESLRLDGTYKPIEAWGVRHLSIRTDNLSILRDIKGLNNLRTLISFGPFQPETADSLTPLLKKQHHLFTLDLTGCGMTYFPELPAPEQLRYLNLSDTSIEELHSNFTELTDLQVLNLQGCQFESFPPNTNRLVNLRHIIGPSWLISKLSNIGEFTNLQELEEFAVGSERGYEIQQLRGMNQLGGSLSITHLENASSTSAFMLTSNNRLISLKLEWCRSYNHQLASDMVIKDLEPPVSVKQLEITGYDGVTLNKWLDKCNLSNVSEITLRNCMNLVELCFTWRLSELRVLKLQKLTSLDSVTLDHFLLLAELYFEDLPKLNYSEKNDLNFPKLRLLVLKNCPSLDHLPSFWGPCLQEMHIEEVGLSTLPLPKKQAGENETSLSYIKVLGCKYFYEFKNRLQVQSNLRKLILENCPNFRYFNWFHSFLPSSLTHLEITGRNVRDETLYEAFKFLYSLSVLKITHCPNLIVFPSLMPLRFSLKLELLIEDCNKLTDLSGLETLSSLKKLCIRRCPQLEIVYSSTEEIGSGLSKLENLCTDFVFFFLIPLVESPMPLRALRIEEILDNGELKWLLEKGPFGKGLEQLSLVNCAELTRLPREMKELVCLKRLYLENCPVLRSLPDLPNRLEELHIVKCPLLEETCEEDGSDWSKIAYVPYKYFDWQS